MTVLERKCIHTGLVVQTAENMQLEKLNGFQYWQSSACF